MSEIAKQEITATDITEISSLIFQGCKDESRAEELVVKLALFYAANKIHEPPEEYL